MKNPLNKLLATLTIVLISNFTFAQISYVIKGNSVNVRVTPSLNGKVLGTLQGGDIVSVTNYENPEWYFISYYGTEGYIASKLLVRLEDSEQYKDWEKQNASTGDNPECENISPTYDNDLDNKLLIHVGNNNDAVVKLMNYSGNCIRIAYIKSSDSYSMKNIPEGFYYLKIAYGKDFRKYTKDGNCIVKFMVDASYKQGSEKLDYYKVKRPNTIEGDYEVEHWQLPSYELNLNTEFTKGSFNTFRSNKITEVDFNK